MNKKPPAPAGIWHEAHPTGLKKISMVLLTAILLNCLSINVYADSFRCGRKLVRTGDSASRVLQQCGEPRFKDSGVEKIRSPGGSEKVNVKRWYYKGSSRSLERIVLIYRGKVVAIKTGKR